MRRAVVAAAFLVAVLYGISLIEIEVPDSGAALLREASRRTGLAVDAEAFRFSLGRGLELTGVSLERAMPGVRYRCDADRMSFGYRLGALARGRLELTAVVLESPRLAVETGFVPVDSPRGEGSARGAGSRDSTLENEAPSALGELPLALDVTSLSLRGASLTIDGAPMVRDLDVRIDRPSLSPGALTVLHALSGRGDVEVGEVSFSSARLVDARARFAADGGRYEFSEALWSVGDAVMEGGLDLDLNSIPPRYRIQASARHRRLRGVLSVDAAGYGVDLERLEGTAELTLPEGRFDDEPIFRALGLAGEEHERLVTPIRIEDGVLTLGGESLSGTVRIDGAVDLNLLGRRVGGSWSRPVEP